MRTALLVLLVAAVPAVAEESIRDTRQALVAVTAPEGLAISNHDATVPIPGVRIGYTHDHRWAVDLGVGYMPMPYDAYQAIGHIGARAFVLPNRLAPYVMSRLGWWGSRPDEGDPTSAVYLIGGVGVEYAGRSGFTMWLEAGAGAARYTMSTDTMTESCFYGSAGVGYRFGIGG
jgi:hypothetical protein